MPQTQPYHPNFMSHLRSSAWHCHPGKGWRGPAHSCLLPLPPSAEPFPSVRKTHWGQLSASEGPPWMRSIAVKVSVAVLGSTWGCLRRSLEKHRGGSEKLLGLSMRRRTMEVDKVPKQHLSLHWEWSMPQVLYQLPSHMASNIQFLWGRGLCLWAPGRQTVYISLKVKSGGHLVWGCQVRPRSATCYLSAQKWSPKQRTSVFCGTTC